MNKEQLRLEKDIVNQMTRELGDLTLVDRKELLRLRCRTEFPVYAKFITREVGNSGIFKSFPVHELICSYVQNICDGDKEFKRTTISLPPRTGKSLLISKLMPSWQMGRSPTAQFIVGSYALKLTHENSRAILNYTTSQAFSWLFPECSIDINQCNLKTIRTGQGGLLMAASAGAGITGFGYGVISDDDLPGVGILDDLLEDGNSMQKLDSTFAWTTTQFLTRGLPNNCVMSIGTRFHESDVIGRLLASDPEGWKELNVPALCLDEENDPLGRKLGESHWPEFFPVEDLERIRKQDESTFNTLYLGRPQGKSGAIFKDFWFPQHEENLNNYEYIYATADTAIKKGQMNDFSVMCVFGVTKKTRQLHLMHVYKEKMEFPELLKVMPMWVKLWKVRALHIESRSSGLPLVQMFRKELKIIVKEVIPVKDKEYRANEISPICEEGRVSLYSEIPDLSSLIVELGAFPFSKKDDFVDAFSMGVKVYKDEIMGSSRARTGGERGKLPQMVYSSGSTVAPKLFSGPRQSKSLSKFL